MQYIDLTPSWSGVFRIYLAVLANPDATADARITAEQELQRMADLADRYVASAKAGAK